MPTFPRHVSQRQGVLIEVATRLSRDLGYVPSDQAIAHEMGTTAAAVWSLKKRLQLVGLDLNQDLLDVVSRERSTRYLGYRDRFDVADDGPSVLADDFDEVTLEVRVGLFKRGVLGRLEDCVRRIPVGMAVPGRHFVLVTENFPEVALLAEDVLALEPLRGTPAEGLCTFRPQNRLPILMLLRGNHILYLSKRRLVRRIGFGEPQQRVVGLFRGSDALHSLSAAVQAP